VLLGGKPRVFQRRLILYAACLALAFISHARAGIAAAFVSSAILCLVIRRYKLFIQGLTVLAIVLSATALFLPQAISSLTTSVVYKDTPEGILASRMSPWQTAIDNIRDHPWFGMGLGTTASGTDADEPQGTFSSSGRVTAEHGSSYLAILAGVGIVGAIPFVLMLSMLIRKVARTMSRVRESGSIADPAMVLAALMIAGIVHATFEDWMFAPGNYLCVFFWTLAFVFNDIAPKSPRRSFLWHQRPAHGAVGRIASSS